MRQKQSDVFRSHTIGDYACITNGTAQDCKRRRHHDEAIMSPINNRINSVVIELQQTPLGKLLKHYEMVPI